MWCRNSILCSFFMSYKFILLTFMCTCFVWVVRVCMQRILGTHFYTCVYRVLGYDTTVGSSACFVCFALSLPRVVTQEPIKVLTELACRLQSYTWILTLLLSIMVIIQWSHARARACACAHDDLLAGFSLICKTETYSGNKNEDSMFKLPAK